MSAEQIAEIERELEIWQPDEGSCRAREAYLETYPYSPLRAPQARPLSNSCTTTENAERPWEGYWRAARDDATLTLEIGEQKVSGTLKVRAKRYPVSGTVDETGYVRAVIDAAPGTLGGPGRLSGAFPEIGVTSVGTGGMGQRLALYQGRVFRVCE